MVDVPRGLLPWRHMIIFPSTMLFIVTINTTNYSWWPSRNENVNCVASNLVNDMAEKSFPSLSLYIERHLSDKGIFKPTKVSLSRRANGSYFMSRHLSNQYPLMLWSVLPRYQHWQITDSGPYHRHYRYRDWTYKRDSTACIYDVDSPLEYNHFNDVIMGAIASQITSLTIFSQALIQTQIKENIKAPRCWPLCAGNHRGPVNSPHKWPVTRKMFPFDDVIMIKPEEDEYVP